MPLHATTWLACAIAFDMHAVLWHLQQLIMHPSRLALTPPAALLRPWPPGLRPGLMRPGLLYRAAMEGATFTLLAGMQRMKDYGIAAT